MFDQVLESLSKATESTMRLQRELCQEWMHVSGVLNPQARFGNDWADRVRSFQKKWAEGLIDLLSRHRATLDDQYRAGIRVIEDAFRVAEAKDPEQFRKLFEALWRQSFECLKTAVESQMRDSQAAAEKGFEVVSKGVSAATA